MSVVKTRFKNKENKYKIYSECTKMPIIENKPNLTDIMNELKNVQNDIKKINTELNNLDTKLNNLDAKVNNLDTKLNNVIGLNNLKV